MNINRHAMDVKMAKENSKPIIPSAEYPERWKKVQGMMDEEGLDFLIAYADDRATYGPAHARWLANFPVHFEPVCILMFQQGNPIMLTGPESDQYALLAGRVPDVRVLRELTHPNEDYPFSRIQSLAEIVAEMGVDARSPRRAGLAGQGLINGSLLHSMISALPG